MPYGCAPADFSLYYAPYPSNQSILTWLETQVFLDTWSPLLTPPPGRRGTDCSSINGTGNPDFAMTNSGAIRFDVFKGRFTADSVINVSPFTSAFRCLTAVPAVAARQLVAKLNLGPPILLLKDQSQDIEASSRLMEELRISPPVPMTEAEEPDRIDAEYTDQVLFDSRVAAQPGLLPGYVTKDDAGTDGDDTPHSPYPIYSVPNVIGATIALPSPTPTVIDLVYNEFMEKAVLSGLQSLGSSYTSADTKSALGGKSLTAIVADWIRRKWPGSSVLDWKEDL